MKVSKEWANNEITYIGTNQQQQLTSFQTICSHGNGAHKAALKLLAQADTLLTDNVPLNTLSRQKLLPQRFFVKHIKWQVKTNRFIIFSLKLIYKN